MQPLPVAIFFKCEIMKILLIFAIVAVVYSAPTDISDNNIGNIVRVGIDANLKSTQRLDFTSVSLEVIRRNLQAILLSLNRNGDEPESKSFKR